MAKVKEELQEIEQAWSDPAARAAEIGDLLFTCVNLARHAGVDAETTLRQANRKFEGRFRAMEHYLAEQAGTVVDATAEEMEQAWEAIKDK